MKGAVVDASVAVKWAVSEPHSEQALSLLTSGILLLAPAHWLGEAATALWARCAIHGALAREDLDEAIDFLVSAPMEAIPLNGLVAAAVSISLALRVTVYDSLYVALAAERELPFVTADRRLLERMQKNERFRRTGVWVADIADYRDEP